MENKAAESLLSKLDSADRRVRLEGLAEIMETNKSGIKAGDDNISASRDVNSHIHTIYSFSPYSPSAAVYHSLKAGLVTTGIMDHDSVAGAREFIEAGSICKMPVTVGAELRISFAGTAIEGRRINNPDQDTVAYVAFHGIPHSEIDAVADFFVPIGKARERRNRAMTGRINELLSDPDIHIDYDNDVLPISMKHEGGSVTERHLLFALACKITGKFSKGSAVPEVLKDLGIIPKGRSLEYLEDRLNPQYEYDLLNVLKGSMVEKFYLPATDECVPVSEAAAFAKKHGIVLAYAYLGDVTDSVTGDKKAQKFEDDYLELLFKIIADAGFDSVTYMPSRNTSEQLSGIRELCNRYGLFQISGEDINQPRQKFVCEAMRSSEFSNLYDSAWALIGHELEATNDKERGMFSPKSIEKFPDLQNRITEFRDKAMAYHDVATAK